MLSHTILLAVGAALLVISNVAAGEQFKPLKGQTVLRVCADAHNLPYSNAAQQGFDNKIATLIADELGIPLTYYWFPQRIGFTRNTIKKVDPETGLFLCDLAMSVPSAPGRLATTKPYFRSIDAMVYRANEGFDLTQISDIAKLKAQGKTLKIGLFDRAIATQALLNNGLGKQITYYQFMSGDAQVYPGRIIEDELAQGRIDVAFVWGPIAGYFADKSVVPMKVVPLVELGNKYVFSFSLGVRRQDKAWKDLLNQILDKRKADIAAIINEYHLPALANLGTTATIE